jgi:hypothetical protein
MSFETFRRRTANLQSVLTTSADNGRFVDGMRLDAESIDMRLEPRLGAAHLIQLLVAGVIDELSLRDEAILRADD